MGKRTGYDPYDHFMLRSPLLPLSILPAVPESPGKLLPWLKELWMDPLIREGLALASYEFGERIEQEFNSLHQTIPDTALMFSLLRYLTRFSSRCTPFGIFAGFSTGILSTETSIQLVNSDEHHLHARPDMEYLMGIARILEKDPAIREKLLFSGNTTLYRVGSRWHYVEVGFSPETHRKTYDIVTVDDNSVIGDILDHCHGGRALAFIRDHLIARGWEMPEVGAFADSLVESQVLVSNLEPVVCGSEYLESLLSNLGQEFETNPVVRSLEKIKILFDAMDRPSTVLPHLSKIDSILSEIPVEINKNHLVQVDMKLESRVLTIDSKISGQILLGLRILKFLSSENRADVLKGFREAFIKRYGDRKVLLVNALDPETGVGLEGSVEGYWTDPVPWIDDLRWGPSFGPAAGLINPGNRWLAGKLHETIRDRRNYIILESSDLQSMGIHDGTWPDQMTALAELFDDEKTGEVMINLLHGSSGNPAFLLGRFGFADPGSTMEWIRQLIDDERADDPDSIYAEVVHLPEDRTGNVLQRPSFLEDEIPYLARSVKDADNQYPATDLMVSIENQKVVLSSRRSGQKIRPRMTNAYNHQMGNLALYKFLYRIQLQDSNVSFKPDWGEAARHARFIPGIRFGNLVLAAPVWLIRCEDLAGWIHPENSEVDMNGLNGWKNERQMPDEMLWISDDQELYFKWSNANLVLALWDTIRNLHFISVRPFYLSKGTPVKGPEGFHANQFVFCYRKS